MPTLSGRFIDGMPHVEVEVEGRSFDALLDTGYDGFVMLPRPHVSALGLTALAKTIYRTADGSEHEGVMYRARVRWLGRALDASIDRTDGDFSLVGMKLLSRARLEMEPARDVLPLTLSD